MKPEAIISGLVGTAAAFSPLQDLPIRVFLLFTDFSQARDPFACYNQFLNDAVQPGPWAACGSFNPMYMEPMNALFINGIVFLVALALIGLALYIEFAKPSSV